MSQLSTTSSSSTRGTSIRYARGAMQLCTLYSSSLLQVSVAIPMTYLVSTWLFTGVNISLVSAVPLHARIGLGYVLFILSLTAIPLIDLLVHSCTISIHVAYYLTIFTVAVVGVGSGGEYWPQLK